MEFVNIGSTRSIPATIQQYFLRLAISLLGFVFIAEAETKFPCQAPPQIQKEIDSVLANTTRLEDRITELQKLIQDHPQDLFAHMEYLSAQFWRDPGIALREYKEQLDKHADDPRWFYLYGRALRRADRKEESMEAYQKALQLEPDFPQLHEALANYYWFGVFENQEKLKHHTDELICLCPGSSIGYSYLSEVKDVTYLRRVSASLREFLADKGDGPYLELYPYLWSTEFRAIPIERHENLKRTIAEDVSRLQKSEVPDIQWWLTLKEGYYYLENYEKIDEIVSEITKRYSTDAAPIVRDHWFRTHPRPDTEEKRKKYDHDFFVATGEWIKKWPRDLRVWFDRLDAITDPYQAPIDAVEQATETVLTLLKEVDAFNFYTDSTYFQIAKLYIQYNINLDRVPELLEKGKSTFEREQKWLLTTGNSKQKEEMEKGLQNVVWQSLQIQAQLHLKRKDFERLDADLMQMDSIRDKSESGEQAYEYWELRAVVAEAKNQKSEAEKYRALSSKALHYENDELGKPLPEFVLQDTKGKKWQLSDLK